MNAKSIDRTKPRPREPALIHHAAAGCTRRASRPRSSGSSGVLLRRRRPDLPRRRSRRASPRCRSPWPGQNVEHLAGGVDVCARRRSCVARRRGGLLGLRRSGMRSGGVVVVDGDSETSQTRGRGKCGGKWRCLADITGPRALFPYAAPKPNPTGWVSPGCVGANFRRNDAIWGSGGPAGRKTALSAQNGAISRPGGTAGDALSARFSFG